MHRRTFLATSVSATLSVAAPPSDAVILFDGTNLDRWTPTYPGDAHFAVREGCIVVNSTGPHPRCRLATKESFGDCHLHLEFWLPLMADQTGQARSNSGVYISGRYEVQMLDTYGKPAEIDGAGAIYKVAMPLKNACLPPEQWQTFDIQYRAARLSAGKVTEKPRMTVDYNGVRIHENVELPVFSTPNERHDNYAVSGPVFLQNHRAAVRFRNIWLRKL